MLDVQASAEARGSQQAEAATATAPVDHGEDDATQFSRSPSSLEGGSELTAPAASNPQPPSTAAAAVAGASAEPAVTVNVAGSVAGDDSSSGTEPPLGGAAAPRQRPLALLKLAAAS